MVTIVMPAWNEGEIIEACVREWYDEVVSKIPGSQLIVVDDCSTDATGRIVRELGTRLPGVICVRPERNGGHGKALRTGFEHATQEFVFQTDSDRQHLPSDFWKLWELRDQADFVFGIRSERADGTVRVVITRCMRLRSHSAGLFHSHGAGFHSGPEDEVPREGELHHSPVAARRNAVSKRDCQMGARQRHLRAPDLFHPDSLQCPLRATPPQGVGGRSPASP